jgi:hypothetical protein
MISQAYTPEEIDRLTKAGWEVSFMPGFPDIKCVAYNYFSTVVDKQLVKTDEGVKVLTWIADRWVSRNETHPSVEHFMKAVALE